MALRDPVYGVGAGPLIVGALELVGLGEGFADGLGFGEGELDGFFDGDGDGDGVGVPPVQTRPLSTQPLACAPGAANTASPALSAMAVATFRLRMIASLAAGEVVRFRRTGSSVLPSRQRIGNAMGCEPGRFDTGRERPRSASRQNETEQTVRFSPAAQRIQRKRPGALRRASRSVCCVYTFAPISRS